ncbi:MAG TPA: hypothetical protein VFW26_01500 [Gaiellales bacterium]|nr:hypothetical protein [Gaiellales bacterium]
MLRAARSSAALAAVLLLAGGCFGGSGGGSSSAGVSHARFVAQARAICATYQKRIALLKGATTLPKVAQQGRRAIALEAAELKALRALTPPDADRAAFGHLLDSLQTGIATAQDLVAAADSGNTAKVASDAATLRAQLAATNRLAVPFHLALCAS